MIYHDILICWPAPDFGPFTIFPIAMAWKSTSNQPAFLPRGRAPRSRLQGSGHERLTFGADHLLAVLGLPPTPLHEIFQVFGGFGLLESTQHPGPEFCHDCHGWNMKICMCIYIYIYTYIYIYIIMYNRIVIIYVHCFSILPWLASTLLSFRWFEVLYSCYGW